ncbi:MAG: hypothetical protein ABSF67_04385 [Roseiarcus sp.]|jgi:hypothetical protein
MDHATDVVENLRNDVRALREAVANLGQAIVAEGTSSDLKLLAVIATLAQSKVIDPLEIAAFADCLNLSEFGVDREHIAMRLKGFSETVREGIEGAWRAPQPGPKPSHLKVVKDSDDQAK